MLTLILAESALETVPKEIANSREIIREARRRNKKPEELLLDSGKHFNAIKRLDNFEKRGRPDIIHFCLLLALDSPVNKRGELRVVVHTLADKIIYINPNVRLPRTYGRFCGLMEKLFKEGEIKTDGEILLSIEDGGIESLLEKSKKIIVLSRDGEQIDRNELNKILKEENGVTNEITIVIGGFSHGKFSDKLENYFRMNGIKKYSIGNEEFAAWTVVSFVLNSY